MSAADFAAAVEFIASTTTAPPAGGRPPDDATKLRMYALYKQATEGPCTGDRPSVWHVVARAKHDAWKSLAGVHPTTAQEQYVALLDDLYPQWRERVAPHTLARHGTPHANGDISAHTLATGASGGLDVSRSSATTGGNSVIYGDFTDEVGFMPTPASSTGLRRRMGGAVDSGGTGKKWGEEEEEEGDSEGGGAIPPSRTPTAWASGSAIPPRTAPRTGGVRWSFSPNVAAASSARGAQAGGVGDAGAAEEDGGHHLADAIAATLATPIPSPPILSPPPPPPSTSTSSVSRLFSGRRDGGGGGDQPSREELMWLCRQLQARVQEQAMLLREAQRHMAEQLAQYQAFTGASPPFHVGQGNPSSRGILTTLSSWLLHGAWHSPARPVMPSAADRGLPWLLAALLDLPILPAWLRSILAPRVARLWRDRGRLAVIVVVCVATAMAARWALS